MPLVHELYDTVDDIVIIDGSSTKNNKELLKKAKKLGKVRIFHTLNLGYAEPLRTYGINKCKGKWILLLDVDEKLSGSFRGNLRQLLKGADFDVLKVKRYENFSAKGKENNFYTWQIRLFRKGSLEYLGLTHEHPKIYGRLKKLDEGTGFIKHMAELRHKRTYDRMYIFSNKNMGMLILQDIIIGINIGKVKGYSDLKEIYNSQAELKSQQTPEIKEIGKIIRKKGIIKYLGLDDDKVIQRLYTNHKGEKQGIELLIKLLKDKHEGKSI